MNAGDMFRFVAGSDIHRWVIISDPRLDPDKVLFVSIPSYDPREDQACILEKEDHPSLTHRSLVAYSRAKVAPDAALDTMLALNNIRMLEPASPQLLDRIRHGAMDSTRMKLDHADILMEQGLV